MFKVLFLILLVMSSFVLAQTNENQTALKFDDFESITNGDLKQRMNRYTDELNKSSSAQGYIINFGTNKKIAGRERQIRNFISFCRYDASRIVIVNGGFRGEIKTELWIVPYGAEPPTIESALNKLDEFGDTANGDIKVRLDNFFVELQNHPNKKGYVVTRGAARAISRRERLIRNFIFFRKFDSSRIKIINDGINDETKTELWIDL